MNGVALQRTFSWNWITGRNFDLMLYAGACLSSYLMVYLHVGMHVPAVLLWWIWIVAVDGPHVFATISRTYLDTEERKERGKLLAGSLMWFLLGPASILLGVAFGVSITYFIFLTFASLWAYWHVVRQHYGFLVLYQKKNHEPAGKQNRVDYWSFYILMLAPFVSFALRHPAARIQVGLAPEMTAVELRLLLFLHALIVFTLIAYAGKEAWGVRQGKALNVPKNLFLMACVPLHLLIFLHPYISTHIDLILFNVFVTFYHNIQYHGIVWFYNRNRYGPDTGGARYGAASFFSRNFLIYYSAGILFTLIYRYSNWYFMGLNVPFLSGPNAISETPIGPHFKVSDLAFSFWWGFAFNHYCLDQKIWRVSKDRRLNQELKLV